jgi:hypothetical protein
MGGVASEIRLLAVVKTHILEEVRFRLVKNSVFRPSHSREQEREQEQEQEQEQ